MVKNQNTQRVLTLSSALLLTTFGHHAHAAGFALIENSGSGMGNAYAGAAAVAEDASTIFFNPAGLTLLEKPQMVFAGHIISTKADFSDKGSNLNPALTGGVVVPGSIQGTEDDGGGIGIVPNFYYARPINDQLFFGLGVNAPFGLETDYEDDWVGRYHALNSAIQTININPSLAYRVNDKLSIGGGISIQYVHAELSQAIDSTAVCLNVTGGDVTTCTNVGLSPDTVGGGTVDSKAELEADNVDYGFNLGLTYQATPATRIGAAYRSSIEHTAEGDAKFSLNAGLAALLGPVNAQLAAAGQGLVLADSDITASVELPESFSLSFAHQATPKLQVLGDVTWTGWSSFDELRIHYDSGQDDSVTEEAWEDVMRYSLGFNFAKTDQLTLRAGVAFDEEAIPDPEHRTPRIPGNDRTWVSVGAGYDYSPTFHVDVGFAHLFVDETPADHTDENGYTFRGEYSADVNILSAQLNWNF